MQLSEQTFTNRQHMLTQDFEFFHYHNAKPVEVDFHNHNFYELYFFISGSVTYAVEGNTYKLIPGDILIINDKELHKAFIRDDTSYERIVIWLNPNYLKSYCTEKTDLLSCFDSSRPGRNNLLRMKPEQFQKVYEIVQGLGTACSGDGYGNDLLKGLYLQQILIYINKAYLARADQELEPDSAPAGLISRIIQYINANLEGDISLDTLSSMFYISKYYLSHQFKSTTGLTLHKYIQQKRLIAAKELLKESRPISEVCSKCGFGDYSHFIRTFKNEYGVSPKKYCKTL